MNQERIAVPYERRRLKMHERLGDVPFIPRVLEVDEDSRRVWLEVVPGVTWHCFLRAAPDLDKQLVLEQHLQVGLKTVEQVRQIRDEYSVWLGDRNPKNVMVAVTPEGLKVSQVDLGEAILVSQIGNEGYSRALYDYLVVGMIAIGLGRVLQRFGKRDRRVTRMMSPSYRFGEDSLEEMCEVIEDMKAGNFMERHWWFFGFLRVG